MSKPENVDVVEETGENLTRSSFVRQMIMRNPNVSLEEIQDAWGKAGHTTDLPKSHDMHMARTKIRNKYGVADPIEIPRKKSGEINVTGLIRLVLQNNPTYNEKTMRRFLLPEGIEFTTSLWSVMRCADKKKAMASQNQEKVDLGSPDENQNAGPRARRRGVRGRPRFSENRKTHVLESKPEVDSSVDLMQIEESLDLLIQQSTDPVYIQALRSARRHISMGILTSSN